MLIKILQHAGLESEGGRRVEKIRFFRNILKKHVEEFLLKFEQFQAIKKKVG